MALPLVDLSGLNAQVLNVRAVNNFQDGIDAQSSLNQGNASYLNTGANEEVPDVPRLRHQVFRRSGPFPDSRVRRAGRRTSSLIRWMCPRPRPFTSQPSSK